MQRAFNTPQPQPTKTLRFAEVEPVGMQIINSVSAAFPKTCIRRSGN
jgi:hypothetical protein